MYHGARATYKLIALNTEKRWVAVVGLLYYFVIYGRYSGYQNDCNLDHWRCHAAGVYLFRKSLWGTLFEFCFMSINREDFRFIRNVVAAFATGAPAREPVLRNRALFSVAQHCWVL